MFISTAWAQGAAGAGPSMLESFLPLVLIFAVFYFLLIRPQNKKQKEQRAKLTAVRRGDKVLTGGGLYGTVIKVVDDNEITVEIAEGIKVRVNKHTLSDVMSKTEPANDTKSSSKKEDKKEDKKEETKTVDKK